jgi:hypothetical protein
MKGKETGSTESGRKHKVLLDRRWGVLVSEVRSRQVGGANPSELMRVGITGPIINPFSEFSVRGGWEKEKCSDFRTGWKVGETAGGMEEENEHVPPSSFVRRLGSTPTLVPRFGLDRAGPKGILGPLRTTTS